jgi:hypothetical protein
MSGGEEKNGEFVGGNRELKDTELSGRQSLRWMR